jgi:formate dehydrogenase maturation protein FdhE
MAQLLEKLNAACDKLESLEGEKVVKCKEMKFCPKCGKVSKHVPVSVQTSLKADEGNKIVYFCSLCLSG